MHPRVRPILTSAAVASLLAVAVLARFVDLGTLPGINGDEAWYGHQVLAHGGNAFGMRTPSENVPGPLHLAMLWLLLKVLPPTFFVLRLPVAITGVLAIATLYLALKKPFGRPASAAAALLLATSPVAIIYGRLGWDPSHGFFLGALALYLAFNKNPLWLIPTICFAVVCHPTNVFLVPLLLPIALSRARRRRRRFLLGGVLLLGLVALPWLCLVTTAAQSTLPVRDLVARVTDGASWTSYPLRLAAFFSGERSLSYVVGPARDPHVPCAIAVLGALLLAVATFGFARFPKRARLERALLFGCVFMLLAFALLAGPDALIPHAERYALVLVVPILASIAVLLRRGGTPGRILVGLFALASLLELRTEYFRAMRTTGGLSHRTFVTGRVEPKAAAFEWILSKEIDPARIIVEDYWLYESLAFLASKHPGLRVELAGDTRFGPKGVLFFVGYDPYFARRAVPYLRRSELEEHPVLGYGGREVLYVAWSRDLARYK